VHLDTGIVVQGSPEVAGTAAVFRRRIVSLLASGAPPGGSVSTEIVCAAGDVVGLWVGLATDPVSEAYGTRFLSLPTAITIAIGIQGPTEHFPISIPLPNAPEFLGFPLAMQAANLSPTRGLELSNPVVVIVA
jgi:hypothetical protein